LALSIEKGTSLSCYSCTSSSVSPTAGCATGSLTSATSITCPTGLNYC
uniref:Uncharacterized protein n=1 Tax=Ciona savignyi TaxID=51511 RepID=H2ZHE0_CIOSA